ncbi:MAG: transglycosylase domain-containing protein, partial [Pseudonocardiales bacterium]|nr:transglycosylase domain-containing protein [Pseudonocardiales bacterium]
TGPGGRSGGGGPRRRSSHRRPRTPEQRRRDRLVLARRIALGGVAAVLLAPLLAFGLGYLFFAVPSPADAVTNQVALVSYTDGSQLTRLVPEEGNRTAVAIAEVPQHVRDAVLSAEDRTFYSNPGFDVTGILRAAWNQLRGGSGGGSTITQQYVKNALVGDEYSLWRKYKEVVLAVKISGERSKDEILGDYLNAIYFGRGAYGIQSASQAYFGKPVQLLDVSEGAMLAGLIQSPSRWDPAVNAERAVQRWEFVLDGMVAEGWLGPAERAAALFPATVEPRRGSAGVPADSGGHIVTAVRAELESLGITGEDLAQEGLRITTTIDPEQQERAVAVAEGGLDGQPDELRTAMVAVDPRSGGITAYYGGANGLGLDYAQVRRLAGSTFKPFVVLAGLLQDPPVGLGERFDGEEVPGLRNAEGADCDECDLKQAMTVSNNVIFNTLAKDVGAQAVADAARAAGITAPLEDPNEGIALGNKEVSVLELASAYATIAAGGVWHQPHLVAEVVTADGRVLYSAPTEGERRFPERVARNVTEAMLDVAEADGLELPDGRPVAAKTGTVQSRFEGENNDAWMAGFTPQLASSVWIGTDRNDPIRTASGEPIAGKGLPGELWQEFMGETLEEQPVETFAPFRPIGEEPSDRPPGEPEVTATPEPSPSPTPEPTPSPAPPPPGEVPPADPSGAPGAGPPDGDGGGGLLLGGEPEPEPDCSVTPCG